MSVTSANEIRSGSFEDEETKSVKLSITTRLIVEFFVGLCFILLCASVAGAAKMLGTLFIALLIAAIVYILLSRHKIEYRTCYDYFTYFPVYGDSIVIYLDEIGSVTSTKKVIRSRRFRYTVEIARIDYKNPEPGTGESCINIKKNCLNYGGFEHFLVQKRPDAFYGHAAGCLFR